MQRIAVIIKFFAGCQRNCDLIAGCCCIDRFNRPYFAFSVIGNSLNHIVGCFVGIHVVDTVLILNRKFDGIATHFFDITGKYRGIAVFIISRIVHINFSDSGVIHSQCQFSTACRLIGGSCQIHHISFFLPQCSQCLKCGIDTFRCGFHAAVVIISTAVFLFQNLISCIGNLFICFCGTAGLRRFSVEHDSIYRNRCFFYCFGCRNIINIFSLRIVLSVCDQQKNGSFFR